MNSTDRVKAHRDRTRTGETIPLCTCGCKRQLKGEKSRSRGLASVCWKKSAEGKQETRDRVRQHRKKEG
ncbi:MAG: hypothetical protein H7Z11_01040 [Verrucomicrobia bacterium]|nr:hypothetical protein [Leptolyngbya sp. ES-bin-22]